MDKYFYKESKVKYVIYVKEHYELTHIIMSVNIDGYEREPAINFIFVGLDKSDAIAILDEIKSHNIIKYIENRHDYVMINWTNIEDDVFDILFNRGIYHDKRLLIGE